VKSWCRSLKIDPVPALLAAGDPALTFFVRRDLLGERAGPVTALWSLPDVVRLLKRQRDDGSWPRAGTPKPSAVNHALIETWRRFRILVDRYGMTREHPQARAAAEYLFACQAPEGDIRGMLADQYATYYTGAILGLLVQAGYRNDPRTVGGLRWLLSMRQDDGGWTIPILTRYYDRATIHRLTSRHARPVEPDRSQPFSHHWTGMVLRAFAAHSGYHRSPEVRAAASLLKSRFFKPDAYASYRAAETWLRFEYPFWWNNLVSALDALSHLGFTADDAPIAPALEWLRDHQQKDGLWKTSYVPGARENSTTKAMQPWITLAVCRIFRRMMDS
jgi:hypothetical protein